MYYLALQTKQKGWTAHSLSKISVDVPLVAKFELLL